MFDKFSQALALMREAFEDAQAGSGSLACVDLAAEVDGAQQVINAASAVQALRVAQYAARVSEQDACGRWVEVDHPVGHVGEFAADPPRSGTWSPCANTTTGSNTTPAGH